MKNYFICFIILYFTACIPVSYQQKATLPVVTKQILHEENLTFITYNGDQYSLQIASISSQDITGTGKKKIKNHDWEDFSGTVSLDSVDIILLDQNSVGTGVLLCISGIMLANHFSNSLQGPDNPTLDFIYPGGSSCPFIYSKTNQGYILEAEAFGTALGKALEFESSSLLPALTSADKTLQVRISNERLETHYINSVSLFAIPHPTQQQVILDTGNKPWSLSHPEKTIYAVDHSGHTITELVSATDGQYWQSDLASTSFTSPLADSIELQFTRPIGCTGASLTIRAINTEFGASVYQSIFRFLGEDALHFIQLMENDPQIISLMKGWIQESALKISYWTSNRWQDADSILPEADAVAFDRLVHLTLPESPDTLMRIKLRSLPDVWKIDAVTIDWTPMQPLAMKPVPLISATGANNDNQTRQILAADHDYTVLLPGDKLEMAFADHTTRNPDQVTYMIGVRGYLHEWLRSPDGNDSLASLGQSFGKDRIESLSFLMQNKRLLLPPIYNDWKKRRQILGNR